MDDIVGFGFRPTDQELVEFYLKHKLLADDPRVHRIPVIDLCNVEPWNVPVKLAKKKTASRIRFGNPDWFFFSPVDFKYSNSKRVNRKTKCGFWKATGKDRDIRSWDTNTLIATKKTLVYYKGCVSRGVKSNWVIHEYHAVTFHESKRTFVLCRLMRKPGKTNEGVDDPLICDEGDPSKLRFSDYENQETAEGIPSGGCFTGEETIFPATPQAETLFSYEQQSPIQTYISNYHYNNAYFGNDNNFMQPEFDYEANEFVNQILVNAENMDTSVNNNIQSEEVMSKLVKDTAADYNYEKHDSSQIFKDVTQNDSTNGEIVHQHNFSGGESSSSCGSTQNGVLDSNYSGIPSSPYQEIKESMLQDDFWIRESSSCYYGASEIDDIEMSNYQWSFGD